MFPNEPCRGNNMFPNEDNFQCLSLAKDLSDADLEDVSAGLGKIALTKFVVEVSK